MTSHKEYVETIKSAATELGKKAVIDYLTKKAPFLFIPVVGPIVSLLIGKVIEILVRETEFAIFFKYIDMRTDAQGRAFSKAALKNFEIQKTGTPDEKAKAEKELIEHFRKFVILTN